MEFGMVAGIITRPDSVTDQRGGEAKLDCSPGSKQWTPRERRFNYVGEAPASSACIIALLRLLPAVECLLAVTVDKPSRSVLLWREWGLPQGPTVGNWCSGAAAQGWGFVTLKRPGLAAVSDPVFSYFRLTGQWAPRSGYALRLQDCGKPLWLVK